MLVWNDPQSAIFAPLMARLSPLLRVGRSVTAAVYRSLVGLFGGAWGDVVAVVTVATSPLRAAFAAAARLFGVVAASSPALRTVFAPIAAASKGVARVASAATAVTVTVTAAGGGEERVVADGERRPREDGVTRAVDDDDGVRCRR